MKESFEEKLKRPGFTVIAVLCVILACILLYYSRPLGVIGLIGLATGLIFENYSKKRTKEELSDFIENLAGELDATVKKNIVTNPLPICIVDKKGFVEWYNRSFGDLIQQENLLYREISEVLSSFKLKEVLDKAAAGDPVQFTIHDRVYRVVTGDDTGDENDDMFVFYFLDITEYENLKKTYKDEKTCSVRIFIDNYEELMVRASDETRSVLSTEVDKRIKQFAKKNMAPLVKYDDDKYYVVMDDKHLRNNMEGKFTVLDDVREIATDQDLPVSLSIGVGAGGKDFQQNHDFSQAAIELALGRGGDQAVVKRSDDVSYFGGRLQTVEKRNKGKSRIMAHALVRILEESSNVLIMGHRNPDMDAFGAAVGMFAFAKKFDKPVHIVMDYVGESLMSLYEYVRDNGSFDIIGPEAALAMAKEDTLLIIVDTHNPVYTESPELVEKVSKKVVIDHHRKMEMSIQNPVLYYMESYASSTCELITEMLQYIGDKSVVSKVVADALLSGITLDTKHFTSQSGVRTFEAASFLRGVGADTAKVRSFFQVDPDLFRVKAKAILDADLIKAGGTCVALSKCEGKSENIGLITAQTADEMLEIKGVKAALAMGSTPQGEIMVSARSIGDINVQVLMEKLGGGGHLNTAGAQLKMSMEEAESRIREVISEEMTERSSK
ncbi:MAG: DHH family phosphoesterase [Firmicutes bacterium]|nr:DHH family phosphoesterase [Bacillota bacterium]